jgi:hypothetical protein
LRAVPPPASALLDIPTGFFGMKSVLIPVQFVETDEQRETLVLK